MARGIGPFGNHVIAGRLMCLLFLSSALTLFASDSKKKRNADPTGGYTHRLTRKRLSREGGSKTTEAAVRAALDWLCREQNKDGSWSAPAVRGQRPPFVGHDLGVTALAVLAFTGCGVTHIKGDFPLYSRCVRKAAGWLRKQQRAVEKNPGRAGAFNQGGHEQWMYDHAIATMAMAELLILTGDERRLKESVTSAVKFCLLARNKGYGWRYGVRSQENDTSVTGWLFLVLETAQEAPLDIEASEYKEAFKGALKWFDRATKDGASGYVVGGDKGSRLSRHPKPYPYSKELSSMTAVTSFCRLLHGTKRSNRSLRASVKILMRELPSWQKQDGEKQSTINFYYWYYATNALFQFGGSSWKTWNRKVKVALLDSQIKVKGDKAGSWDPIGEWGLVGGRVYSTAMAAMTLEVYYRHKRR